MHWSPRSAARNWARAFRWAARMPLRADGERRLEMSRIVGLPVDQRDVGPRRHGGVEGRQAGVPRIVCLAVALGGSGTRKSMSLALAIRLSTRIFQVRFRP